jgi:hypothetical protein
MPTDEQLNNTVKLSLNTIKNDKKQYQQNGKWLNYQPMQYTSNRIILAFDGFVADKLSLSNLGKTGYLTSEQCRAYAKAIGQTKLDIPDDEKFYIKSTKSSDSTKPIRFREWSQSSESPKFTFVTLWTASARDEQSQTNSATVTI